MRRRRLRSYTVNAPRTKTLNNASQTECRIYAYYLYVIVCYKQDFYPDSECCDDFITHLHGMFLKLAKKLNQEKQINDYLAKVILQYAEHKVLTPVQNNEPSDEMLCFADSEIPYLYEEDKKIDRMRPQPYDKLSLLEVNLFRCFYVSQSNEFMLSLIANYLIKKTPAKEACRLDRLPTYLKKSLKEFKELEFVRNAVDLSDDELSLLQCSYRCYQNFGISELLSTFTETCRGEIFSRMMGITKKEFDMLLRRDSKIRLYGFVDVDGIVDEDFCECVEAGSMQPYFNDLLKKQDSDCYELDSFNVPDNTKKIMNCMLKSDQSVSILLYGKPGSGKTEFAKALAKQSGLNTYVFKNERELKSEMQDNVLSRLHCLLSMNSKDSIYIIDEADTLLRTRDFSFFGMISPSLNKGVVNKMLEQSNNKIIWIVNFTSQIDESTLRRFTYSYKFDSMTRSQLRNIAESKLEPLALSSDVNSQILDLIEHYKITGTSVDNVVKTINSLRESQINDAGDSSLVQGVKSVLKENAVLINGKSRMRETVSKNYDLSVLNASMDPAQIVRMVKNAREFAENNETAADSQNGIRMLFYGVSGTGKTEFARYIAEQLGSKILLKRASDILDKYVGGSEQNIRDAFEEAAHSESILLFDEADSFFADRNGAQYSWERTQVNEFLTQMEEFPGILICTTNLKSIMDPAMNRRFHIITEFKPLNKEGINILFQKYFGDLEFEPEQISRLEKMSSVTPGDFSVLASRIRFMDKEERTQKYIINELCKIQEEKEGTARTIGFGV